VHFPRQRRTAAGDDGGFGDLLRRVSVKQVLGLKLCSDVVMRGERRGTEKKCCGSPACWFPMDSSGGIP
jgi:hypothetical protein